MAPQDCSHIEIHGINNLQKWNKIMNAKTKIATLSLIALASFGTLKAQSSNDNLLAFNNASKAKTELKTKKAVMNAPVVKQGDAGDATLASYDDRLAIHITGRNDANMPTEKYATMLAGAFADRKYTDKPMYITVTYSERDQEGETFATIYMDGSRYKTKDGYNVFTPEQIGKAIKTISNTHVTRHGDKHVIKSNTPSTSLVLN